MRLYLNWNECVEEVKRDLAEMGILVKPKTMQDKKVEGNPDYFTKELQNYSYCLLNPNPKKVTNVVQPWADAEFEERVKDPFIRDKFGYPIADPVFVNPGNAWELRKEVWTEYLHNGKFAYTYNEMIWKNDQLNKLITALKSDHDSRQIWISLWNPEKDPDFLGGISRVPCSLGYGLSIREGKLNMHYVMRSCDFVTHFTNDAYLAMKLQAWIAEKVGVPVGTFTHTMFSLHVYQKDVKDVF